MQAKTVIVRGGEYKCRVFKMHLKLRHQPLKTIMYTYRLLYPAKISFRFDSKIKSFKDKQKLRECSTTKTALQQMLKELL